MQAHTHTLTSHLANPDLSQENRPPCTHCVWHCSSPLCYSVPCCWTHSFELLGDEFTHLTGSRAGLCSSLPGQGPLPQLHCADTWSPGSQQRNSCCRQAESGHARASGADTQGNDLPGRQESLPVSFSGRAGVAQHPPAPQQSQAPRFPHSSEPTEAVLNLP